MRPNLSKVRKRNTAPATRRSKRLAQACEARLPSPLSEAKPPSRKRKRQQEDAAQSHTTGQPTPKNRRLDGASAPFQSPNSTSLSYGSAVHWQDYFEQWPPSSNMNDSLVKKRRASSSSYTNSVKNGEAPTAWTRGHEEKMQEAGLFMTDYQARATVRDDCLKMCQELLQKEYSIPTRAHHQPQRLAKLLERVRFCNEARVVRDVTPLVVPSAELLHIDKVANLDQICEALNAEWTQCDTICGPRPKPDFVVGVAGAAFTAEEKEKLQFSHTSASPNLFPENMYYPFLICEVKSSDRTIDAAERQAMHSASIALRALIQLYRKVSAADEVDGKILVFSVAHDPSMIKVFGHFAKIDGDRLTFFRHQLYLSDIVTDLRSQASSRAYQITRAIYDVFFPEHLTRIKKALSKLRGSTVASFTSQLDLAADSQKSTTDQSSSDDGKFKKPSLSSTVMLQQENERLREQLLESMRLQQVVIARQREEQQKQMEQQKEESREQRAVLERQLAQQQKLMNQQKEESQKLMDQQKEESQKLMDRQKEESQKQIALLEKLLDRVESR